MIDRIRRFFTLRHYGRKVQGLGEAELAHLRAFVRPNDLCVDVGAHGGVYAFELSRLGARVLAIEPNPEMVKFVQRLKLPGVDVIHAALSSVNEKVVLKIPFSSNGLATLRDDGYAQDECKTIEVDPRTLDSFDLSDVRFIKIDVEGHEEDVLSGAEKTIGGDRPIILIEVEERHNAGGLARIRAWFEERGYVGRFLKNNSWRSIADFDLDRDQSVTSLLAGKKKVQRRTAGYHNNFLFLPSANLPLGSI